MTGNGPPPCPQVVRFTNIPKVIVRKSFPTKRLDHLGLDSIEYEPMNVTNLHLHSTYELKNYTLNPQFQSPSLSSLINHNTSLVNVVGHCYYCYCYCYNHIIIILPIVKCGIFFLWPLLSSFMGERYRMQHFLLVLSHTWLTFFSLGLTTIF